MAELSSNQTTLGSYNLLQKLIEDPQSQQPFESLEESLKSTIEVGIACIAKQNLSKFTAIAKDFSQALVDSKHIFLHQDILLQCFQELRFVVCKHSKLYSLTDKKNKESKHEVKGYVVVGKAVSVYKRKKKDEEEFENKAERDELSNLIQQGTIRLFQDGKYILPKHEKNYELNDILLHHESSDSSIDEVYLGTQVYSPFVPIQKSIVMVVPSKILKPDCLNFIKSSILHSYVDEAPLLSRIITKEQFYKGSILKGLFFIDEGEVEVNSGRIIARGWTTFGKCKTSGFGWKFKPIPFIRFLLKNMSLWKQFFNDITLNNEYPYNIIHILGLNDNEDFTLSAEWRSLGRKRIGGKSPKLPKLNMTRSINEEKLEEIERLRHYDDRFNEIFTYKQDLLTRKLKGIVHSKFQPIFRDEKSEERLEKRKKILMLRLNSKGSALSKREESCESQPGENILIMSVLKRLESIADINETSSRRQYSITQGLKDNPIKIKREAKILPMQFPERTKEQKRSKRY